MQIKTTNSSTTIPGYGMEVVFDNSSRGHARIQAITVDIHAGLCRIFQVSNVRNAAIKKRRTAAARETKTRFLFSLIAGDGLTDEVGGFL